MIIRTLSTGTKRVETVKRIEEIQGLLYRARAAGSCVIRPEWRYDKWVIF